MIPMSSTKKHGSFVLGALTPILVMHAQYAISLPTDQIESGYPFIIGPIGFAIMAIPTIIVSSIVSVVLSRPRLIASRYFAGLGLFGLMVGSLHLMQLFGNN